MIHKKDLICLMFCVKKYYCLSVMKSVSQPPNTTEESSQNSDLGDTKSLSPPTSVSEISAEAEPRTDSETVSGKMDVDTDSKNSHEPPEERLPDVTQDFNVSLN
jgi:hypothetical protein